MPECLRLFVYICWQYIWFSTSPSAWVHVSIWNVEKLCICFSVCVYAILWHANTPNGHKLQKCWHCFSPTNSLCALSHLCVRIAKRLCDRTTQTSNRPTANAIYTCKTQPSTEEQKNNNSNRARLRVAREELCWKAGARLCDWVCRAKGDCVAASEICWPRNVTDMAKRGRVVRLNMCSQGRETENWRKYGATKWKSAKWNKLKITANGVCCKEIWKASKYWQTHLVESCKGITVNMSKI